jgi:hypothetical protein
MVVLALHQDDARNLKNCDLRDIARRYWGDPPRPARSANKPDFYYAPEGERTPSFAVYPNGFKNYGRGGQAGDHFAFIQLVEGCDFKRAAAILADIVGRPTPHPRPLPTTGLVISKKASAERPSATWQRAALAAVEAAEAYLWSNRPDARAALAYLRTARGLSDETIRRYRLGYNPAWCRTDWRKDDGKPAGLPPGIVIPWLSGGELYKVNVRCRIGGLAAALGIPDETMGGKPSPKYLQLAGGTSAALYNADAIQPGKPALIVEGEFDAMIAGQNQDVAAPVTFGSASNGVAPRWAKKLAEARVVLAALDNDRAGSQGKQRIVKALPFAYAVSVPGGKDVTDYVLAGNDLQAWIVGELAAVAAEGAADRPVAAWPENLPAKWESNLMTYGGKRGAALARLFRAVLIYARDRDFTLIELSELSGIPYRQLWRAMEEYEGCRLFIKNSAQPCLNDRSAHIGILPISDQDNPQCSSVIKASSSQKSTMRSTATPEAIPPAGAFYYRLLPFAEAANALAHDILLPGIVERIARDRLSGRFERASLERYTAIWTAEGQPSDPAAVSDVNARLVAEIPPNLQAGIDGVLAKVRRELSDRRGLPLPDRWRTDYPGALVERDLQPRIGKGVSRKHTQQATGVSRAAQRSAERRINLVREAQYHPDGQIVDRTSELPPARYTPKYKGYPTSATFDDGTIFDYRSKAGRREVERRLDEGQRCRIDYQQASIVRPVTDDELAARREKRDLARVVLLPDYDWPAAPYIQQQADEAARFVEAAHKRAIAVVKWQLRYLGYQDSNGATYDRDGVQVVDRPISALTGSELIAIARGKLMYQQPEPEMDELPIILEPPAPSAVADSEPIHPVTAGDKAAHLRWCDRMEAEYCARHPESAATLFERVTA